MHSSIHSEEYRIRTYTVLIDNLKRIMKLKNISIENMNKDIKKEYEEKIHNLENIIESLKNKSITLQNENTNLKSKLQEEEEEELGQRKIQSESSHSNKPAYRFNHEHASNKIKLKRKK